MKEGTYHILVHKKLQGTLSADEKTRLSQWLTKSTENQSIAKNIENAWHLSQFTQPIFEPNVEDALHRFKTSISIPSNIKEEEAIPATRFYSLFKVAAAVAAIVSLAILFNPFANTTNPLLSLEATTAEKELLLNDGSKVNLNQNSRIDYPEEFANDLRTVNLEGEAFFNITPNQSKPFVISALGSKVKVLGTAFNVRAYDKENTITVTVQSGSVEFSPFGGKQHFLLEKNDQLIYHKERGTYTKEKRVDVQNDYSWFSNKLVFKDTKLKYVLPAIERHFNVKIKLANSKLYECRNYSGSFENNSTEVEHLLSSLATIFDMKLIAKDNGEFRFIGGQCE